MRLATSWGRVGLCEGASNRFCTVAALTVEISDRRFELFHDRMGYAENGSNNKRKQACGFGQVRVDGDRALALCPSTLRSSSPLLYAGLLTRQPCSTDLSSSRRPMDHTSEISVGYRITQGGHPAATSEITGAVDLWRDPQTCLVWDRLGRPENAKVILESPSQSVNLLASTPLYTP